MIKNALKKIRVEPQKNDSLERYNKQNKDMNFPMSVVGGWLEVVCTQLKVVNEINYDLCKNLETRYAAELPRA